MNADNRSEPSNGAQFELRLSQRQLLVDGKAADLGARAFDVLLALTAQQGQVVTKAELLSVVWPGVLVEENNLQVQISSLRKILGAGAIATVPGRGYQLTIPLVPAAHDTVANPSAAASKPSEPLVAVLAFDNMSTDPEMKFFSDGISEDILSRIARSARLKVVGRTSSFQFRGPDKSKAAQTLGATHVVDGSVRRSGNRVRITAHLTDAASCSTLWSDMYDRGVEDIFAVQDEISQAIAQALNVSFSGTKTVAIDPAVYDLYLKVRDISPNMISPSAEKIAALESITRMAPDFAPAWGTLAGMRAVGVRQKTFPERMALRTEIEQIAETCLKLDPGNMQALTARYLLLNPFGDSLAAASIMERANRVQTSADVNLFLPAFYESVGRMRACSEAALSIRELDKQSERGSLVVGLYLMRAGRLAEGLALSEQALKRWPDTHDIAAAMLVSYAVAGNWAAVDRLADPQRLAHHSLRELVGAIAFARTMQYPTLENRMRWLDNLRSTVDETGHIDAGFPTVLTAKFGFVDEIYELLDRAKLGPSGGPNDQRNFLAYTTGALFMIDFPELRVDPRFVKLCARLGLVEYWCTTQKWPDCADTVPYDFRSACEVYRDYPKDTFGGSDR